MHGDQARTNGMVSVLLDPLQEPASATFQTGNLDLRRLRRGVPALSRGLVGRDPMQRR